MELKGKVAAVTGAAGGIGQAITRLLVEQGASVALVDISAEAMAPLVETLCTEGHDVFAVVCDVSDEQAVCDAANAVSERYGNCDILVNNAAILPPPSSLETLSSSDVQKALSVNLMSVFHCTRYFGEMMLRVRRGSIVNIGSTAAHSPNTSAPYGVTKAAVLALTRHTAVEWGPRGVRCNSVSPGFVRTPLSEAQYTTDLYEKRVGMVPLRRLASTDEVAQAVTFFASDASAYITGQDVTVDGGFLQTTLMHAQRPEHQYGGFSE
ncbi:SDR family NAD(P)-dependent oxidoreductase [Burkholderia sp. SCN-KJ]|uniref:SDR family NAD(P)-dependent oxidoreductase n=1 Tax=Burkholderia sp. SCN-KJ TaxID=2969248 RepID=UPI00214FF1C7|nr:SDR family oxidoreductase [Burkholderia sp. SCN-KJ]MCR4470428.1 SDR family oxidoreductase [Burkholderia sp. SCN-KJ]